ncbi:MAG TPA: ATP-binding protein [Thermoleophilaceae bacterium]|nr:ATP-binding protein [Thermoleophilaceae bacterium]
MLRPVPDPSNRDDERSDCPLGICEGNGWVLQEDGSATPCDCRERRIGRARSRGMGTGIPKKFRGVSFDRKPICDLDPFVLRPVRAFIENVDANVEAGRGLWFTGDLGTGKTSLAMLVSQAVEKAGRSVAVYPVTRLLAEIKDTYDSDSTGSYMQLFRRLCSVDLLHLDDLGAEKRTEWVLEQLYAIVNERWQDERSIVVTTNIVDLDELREQIGARTVSRLLEICGDPLPIMGPDLRLSSAG